MKNYSDLYKSLKALPPKRVAVAAAADSEVLECLIQAKQMGMCEAVLIGDSEKIRSLLSELNNEEDFEFIHEPDAVKAARIAVEMVSSGKADVLMKGLVASSDILRAILDPQIGLRVQGNIISSIAVMEVPMLNRFLLLTDVGFIPAPTLEQKRTLIVNAVSVARQLGIKTPKVGILCAAEEVNPKIVSTTDAAELVASWEAGEFPDCVLAGPISLDLSISEESAKHKGYENPVAGNADILVMPSLETGNALYKSMTYFARFNAGGIVAGAAAPIVFTSRSDSAALKLNTLVLALWLAGKEV